MKKATVSCPADQSDDRAGGRLRKRERKEECYGERKKNAASDSAALPAGI